MNDLTHEASMDTQLSHIMSDYELAQAVEETKSKQNEYNHKLRVCYQVQNCRIRIAKGMDTAQEEKDVLAHYSHDANQIYQLEIDRRTTARAERKEALKGTTANQGDTND